MFPLYTVANSNLYKDYKKIIDELIEKKYALK